MSGVIQNGFKDFMLGKVYKSTNLRMGLHSETSVAETDTTLVSPAETFGYAKASMNTWTVSAGQAAHPEVVFTASGGSFSETINGYFIEDITTSTLIHVEVDPDVGVPYTIADTETYGIDLSNIGD